MEPEKSDQRTASSVSHQIEALSTRIEILTLKLEKQSLDSPDKDKPKKSWWTTAVEIVGLPAAILAILFQFSQTAVNFSQPAKTAAETEKIRTEELKLRVELQKQLDELSEKKTKNVTAYEKEFENALPRIEETISKLNQVQQQSSSLSLDRSIAKYLVIYVVFFGIGLFFSIVSHVWSTLLSSIRNSIYAFYMYKRIEGDPKSQDHARKRRERIQKILPFADSILSQVPYIAEWSVRVAVFVALLIPFFNELAVYLGSTETYDSIMQSVRSANVGEAIARVKNMLFP